MTFEIPLSAQAALNRIHREGVPAPAEDATELARKLRTVSLDEALVVRVLTFLLDASLVVEGR